MRSGSVFKVISFGRPRAMSGASRQWSDHGADGGDGSSDEEIYETLRLRKKSPDG
jgi:hypothetical protein